MPGTITPLPGKGATFLIGATSYKFQRWTLTFALDTGEVKHFDSQVDGNSNVWPTVFSNFASGTGTAGGAVDHASNPIPIGAGLYINSTGTVACLHSAGDGMTAPMIVSNNEMSSDASSSDPAQRGISFTLTGPPTRVYA